MKLKNLFAIGGNMCNSENKEQAKKDVLSTETQNNENKIANEAPNVEEYILPLVPTSGIMVGPYVNTSLDMYAGMGLEAVNTAYENDRLVVFAERISAAEIPKASDLRCIGTLTDIKNIFRLSSESSRVSIEGRSRVVIKEIIDDEDLTYLQAKIEIINYDNITYTADELATYHVLKEKYYSLLAISGRDETYYAKKLKDLNVDQGVDYISSNSPLSNDEYYDILECVDSLKRLTMFTENIEMALRTTQLEIELETKVAASFAEEQKNRYLREKKEAINRELLDDDEAIIDDYRTKITALPIAEEYQKRLIKEVDRFEMTPPGSQEASVIQSYFDCVLDLPWSTGEETEFDLKGASAILEEDHYGLEKVKERILEYLAVINLTKSLKSPILCLVGPPGVGKTSIAKSVARATGRKFTRLSLGGMHDEAEIRGHRKTYVGAMAGRIIAGLRQVQSNNPVFLLDEIDKLTQDYHGDPASALLEALDPEQNTTFTDNYVEIPFDLSKVMFITTANTLSTIPDALLDRLEIIDLSGYMPDEKLEIAKRHLVSKQIELNGITADNIEFTDEIILEIINCFTRESGVRQLERSIASLCRKAAKVIVSGDSDKLNVTVENLSSYLGPKVHTYEIAENAEYIGVVNGLAWTSSGGDTLQIEAVTAAGTGKLELTGHLGDVMKESAHIAIGYLRANSEKYAIDNEIWDKRDIHIHVPEGATPKDGPSAGVTLVTALYSTIKQKKVSQKIAMTGEITLTGRVLPIGGLREKLLAAARAEIFNVIIPKANEEDLTEIPDKLKDIVKITFAENIDDIFRFAFGD